MTARVDLRLEVPQAQALAAALEVEAADGPEGSTMGLSVEEGALRIAISAPDLSTLRAATTGTLRLVDAIARALARVDGR